jgi:hypothetical protein
MATVFAPIRPKPSMTTIFMVCPSLSTTLDPREHDISKAVSSTSTATAEQTVAQKRRREIVDAAAKVLAQLKTKARIAVTESQTLLPCCPPRQPS